MPKDDDISITKNLSHPDVTALRLTHSQNCRNTRTDSWSADSTASSLAFYDTVTVVLRLLLDSRLTTSHNKWMIPVLVLVSYCNTGELQCHGNCTSILPVVCLLAGASGQRQCRHIQAYATYNTTTYYVVPITSYQYSVSQVPTADIAIRNAQCL